MISGAVTKARNPPAQEAGHLMQVQSKCRVWAGCCHLEAGNWCGIAVTMVLHRRKAVLSPIRLMLRLFRMSGKT